ncbi:hypothetical protein COOONC_00571 [Cooperia oncophora]
MAIVNREDDDEESTQRQHTESDRPSSDVVTAASEEAGSSGSGGVEERPDEGSPCGHSQASSEEMIAHPGGGDVPAIKEEPLDQEDAAMEEIVPPEQRALPVVEVKAEIALERDSYEHFAVSLACGDGPCVEELVHRVIRGTAQSSDPVPPDTALPTTSSQSTRSAITSHPDAPRSSNMDVETASDFQMEVGTDESGVEPLQTEKENLQLKEGEFPFSITCLKRKNYFLWVFL